MFSEIKRLIRKFLFLRIYRKDTPESVMKFYNKMRFIYKSEFIKRENFSKALDNTICPDELKNKGFTILNLSKISKDNQFNEAITILREKFYEINKANEIFKKDSTKEYLIHYNLELNREVKIVGDAFIDIATKYLGTLPILTNFQMWYSPNESDQLLGSKFMHRDAEDFRQLKIFIPIEEVGENNAPLHVVDSQESSKIYEYLVKKKIVKRRNEKINDEHFTKFNPTIHKILLKKDQCALVDTCACYHFGSRGIAKPRKLLFLHFTTAFSGLAPIFRNYDREGKYSLEKDKQVYGLYKKTSKFNHKLTYH